MHNLYATGFNRSRKTDAVKAVRDARRLFGLDLPESSLLQCKEIIDAIERGEDPQLVVRSEDAEAIQTAEIMLKSGGVEVGTYLNDEGPASQPQATEQPQAAQGPNYHSVKVALVLLAHTDGDPAKAIGAAKFQAKVLAPSEAADIQAEAAGILVDTFA